MKTVEELKTFEKARKEYIPEQVRRLSEEEMKWFRDAKFGMFIHWGIYSMLEKGEWVLFNERLNVKEYEKLAGEFDAAEFNAEKWAKTAKAAGMKYMVLTTRHHDGFCLFDTKTSDFNSMKSAAHRDFVREYVEACRAEGLKVGFYYSPMDWRFPGYFFPELYWENAQEMKKQCWDQLRELMTNYGKIDLLWFDGEWLGLGGIGWGADGWNREPGWTSSGYMKVNYFWESEKLMNMIRQLQPGIMINNRGGWEGDFHVRERRIDGIRTDKPWDSNDCIACSWGYVPDMPVLSKEELIRILVSIVVRDGNYLLNVGPKGDGSMDAEHVKRLAEAGEWLAQYGDTLYGMRGGPVLPGSWGGTVYCDKTVYVHVIDWSKGKVTFPNPGKNLISWNVEGCDSVVLRQSGGFLEIEADHICEDSVDTVIRLEYEEKICWNGAADKETDIYGLADGLD